MSGEKDNILTDLDRAVENGFAEKQPREREPKTSSLKPLAFLLLVAVMITAGIAWAAQAEIESVVRGVGRVIPSSSKQMIQSLEGGIIKRILVEAGTKVSAGDVVVELDDKRYGSLHEGNIAARNAILARVARLQAEIDGAEMITFPSELDAHPAVRQAEEELFKGRREDHQTRLRFKKLLLAKEQERFDALRTAFRTGALPKTERMEREALILKLEEEVETISTAFRREALESFDAARERLGVLVQTMVADEDRMLRTVIRSPINGIVNNILISTVGRVVSSGEVIMEIISEDDPLVIEARIRPADRAFLYLGQEVKVNFTAFDFSVYGGLEGRVETIGVDTVVDEVNQDTFYPVKIRTETNSLGVDPKTGTKLDLVPGMIAEVNILTGKRTVLNYLLKPINKVMQQALRER